MASDLDIKAAWVERVLGVRIAGKEAGGRPVGAVAFTKLVLEWRSAEAAAVSSLIQIGNGVLQHPSVKGTAVAAQVETAAAELATLVPQFGDTLRDLLDDLYNADTEPKKTSARDAVRAGIGGYRLRLQSEPRLPALEGFAAKLLGNGTIHSPLFGILDKIEQAVRA